MNSFLKLRLFARSMKLSLQLALCGLGVTAQAQTLYFLEPVAEQCNGDGIRQYAAIITGSGFSGNWITACRTTTALINGASHTSRNCRWAGGRVWGKFDVPDQACATRLWFEPPRDEGCIENSSGRQYAAIITGNNYNGDWIQACRQTTAMIEGTPRKSRDCRWAGTRVWGKFDVPDSTCPGLSPSPTIPVGIPGKSIPRKGGGITAPCAGTTADGKTRSFSFPMYCGTSYVSHVPAEACTYEQALAQANKLINPSCYLLEIAGKPVPIPAPCPESTFKFCIKCGQQRQTASASACNSDAAAKKVLEGRMTTCAIDRAGDCP